METVSDHPRSEATLLDWIVTPFHVLIFCIILFGFHIPAVLARQISVRALDRVVNLQCFAHLVNIRLTGSSISIHKEAELPRGCPILLVSNHQAMYDIPLIMWTLRERFPRFIAKTELQKFVPTISYALRNSDHVIIDRGKRTEALACIREYGEQHAGTDTVICIFPEGTRSPSGIMRAFKPAGFEMLLRSLPKAVVMPIVVNGTGSIVDKKILPIRAGKQVDLWIGKPLAREERSARDLITKCETIIREKVDQFRSTASKEEQ